MKKIMSAAVFAVALSSIAYADGMPEHYRGAECCAPFNWTGFYVGVQSGWAWQDGIADTGERRSASGAFIGGQLGVNYQVSPNWVIGVEVDHSLAAVKNALIRPDPLVPHVVIADEIKIDDVGSARLRLGYAFGRTLLYGTGGLAWAHGTITVGFPGSTIPAPAVIASESNWHLGWAVGGGVETALARSWTAKVEYIYDSFGKETYLGTPVRFEGHAVRVGLNLLFN